MSGRRRRHEPNPLRPGVARDVTGRLLDGPRELRWDWMRADGRVGVPFALPDGGHDTGHETGHETGHDGGSLLEPRLAERTVSAALRLGADHLLACRTQPEMGDEPVVVVPPHPATLSHQAVRFGPADFVVVPPGFAAALLVTAAGFGVVAGTVTFVETALDADVEEAKRRFAERAWRARGAAPPLTDAAYVFGCALSGRHHAPAWRAWTRPARVPPDSGVGEQLGLVRRLASGEVTAAEFVPAWLAAREREIEGGEHAAGRLAQALRRVLYAVDDFVPDPALRSPADLDETGLVDAVRTAMGALSGEDP